MTAVDAPSIDDPRLIDVPPSSCMASLDRSRWEQPLAVRAGPYDLGVRGDRPRTQTVVRAVAGDRLLAGVRRPMPRNLSLRLVATDEPAQPGVIALHRLHLGHHLVVRARDPRRVVHALDSYIDAHARARDEDGVQLYAVALVRDGRAHLVPGGARRRIAVADRRLRGLGFVTLDRPWVQVDLGTRELVVPDTSRHLAEVDVTWTSGSDRSGPTGVGPGRYPIDSLEIARDGRPAARVVAVSRAIVNLEQLDAGPTIAAVAELVGAVGGAPGPVAQGLVGRVGG